VLSAIPATILLPVIVAALYQLPFRNELVALSIIFIAMIWYLMFSIISGMRTLPTQLLELKNMLRLKWTSAWKNIYIPAVLPSFITGSITAIGGAWNSLIVAEYFSIEINGKANVMTQVGTGIGKVIDIAVFQGNLQLTILALIAMTTMVIIINRLVWQRAYNHVTQKYRSAV
jgi:NitT/TauT family transport system permease protein